MFGRSGQMFPRRTFHDAIYEEEYGSDNEDECCRCRGLSAILCWFLSVIILVGLAATVVLTVFFILRSRTMMVKPSTDVDVEIYGKDQNMYDSGGTSKDLGSDESVVLVESGKSKEDNSERGPDITKNDVDANLKDEQNAIIDSGQADQAEDASVSHPRNHHTTNRNSRLQPYSTTTTTTTEIPNQSEEEEEGTSEEIENEENNEEGSSLFNLFSGPRNPSYSTPHNQDDDELVSKESTIRRGHHGIISAESSSDTRSRYHDGSPVQQVLFTESPKVTVTTPNPYNSRRNLQTTRFPTGRTSFSTTTTTIPPSEESTEEADNADHNENEEEQLANKKNDVGNDGSDNKDEEDVHVENNATKEKTNDVNTADIKDSDDDINESSEEEAQDEHENKSSPVTLPTTTSAYDAISEEESESEMGSQSGESQLKQMLLDEIPPHKKNSEQKLSSENIEGNPYSGQQEFNLAQTVVVTTTARPITTIKTTKGLKTRPNTLTRIISRNFTRQGTTSTTTTVPDSSVAMFVTTVSSYSTPSPPSVTTLGSFGNKYDYTMTPYERTKVKLKSAESIEQEVSVTKPPPKLRYRSTTPKGTVMITPESPSTAAPRTRGTTTPTTIINEYEGKLGGQRGSVESPIDIVPSPDLSPNGQQSNSMGGADLTSASSEESKTSEQFLDVLVGSEDHKTLVTKNTDDGIVTSAILPPWYDTNGAINSSISEILATNGTTISYTVAKVEDEGPAASINFGERTNPLKSSEEKEQASKDKITSKVETGTEFERLVNIFSKQQSSSEEVPPQARVGHKKVKQVVLKKPTTGLLAQSSRYIPQVPGRANLFSASNKDESVTNNESDNPTNAQPMFVGNDPMDGKINNNGDVSRTGVFPTSEMEGEETQPTGYLEDVVNSDKTVEQLMTLDETERLSSSDEMIDSMMDPLPPSHVIDVNFEEADSPQEIIIEQDSSGSAEEKDFVSDDYNVYGENLPTMSMASSTPNQQVVAAPEDFVRGSGIRKPVSSEEEIENDLEGSGSSPIDVTISTTTSSPVPVAPSVQPVVIRRPAYAREEIAKAVVKPSPESVTAIANNENNLKNELDGAIEVTGSEEFEEYEDDNYEDGSVEHQGAGSTEQEHWSTEKTDTGQKWSPADKGLDASPNNPQEFESEEFEEHQSAERQKQVDAQKNLNTVGNTAQGNDETTQVVRSSDNSASSVFKSPKLVSFHENKLSFSPPVQAEGEYHSKDGWRPVLSGSAHIASDSSPDHFSNPDGPPEDDSIPTLSFEDQGEEPQESLYQELPSPQQQLQQISQQQWPTESNGPLEAQGNGKLKPSPMIPPPIPANVKFPDSEEDHEDRHHHGRHKPRQDVSLNNFDRAKYTVKSVPPPIVMRRHPHSTGPYPLLPKDPRNRQPPPPRQQMLPQGPQPNLPFSEHSPGRPPVPPHINNRNFHMRPNVPIRRFNFGPPQAQPRSGGNVKWPSEKDNNNNSEQHIDAAAPQSEIATTSRRKRRREVA